MSELKGHIDTDGKENLDFKEKGQDDLAENLQGDKKILVREEEEEERVEEKSGGVLKISLLHQVFKGRDSSIWWLWISIGLFSSALALSLSTSYLYLQFATSGFGRHSFLGTINVITSIAGSVCLPFTAKIADQTSRSIALAGSLVIYTVGFIIVATSKTVEQVAGGNVIYSIGEASLSFLQGLIVADITSLQWRAFANGLISTPYIVFAFVAGYITEGIGLTGWRWGYGMFTIIIPVVTVPSVAILFWGEHRVKKLSKNDSDNDFSKVKEENENELIETIFWKFWSQIDGFGLILAGTSWTLILLPFTLSATAKGGWKNPSMIAMEVVGWVLQFAYIYYELKIAAHPIVTRKIMNRNFLIIVEIDVLTFVASTIVDTYYLSWIYVIKDWSTKNYTYFGNISTVGLCIFGVVAAIFMKIHKRYKYLLINGILLQVIAKGIQLYARNGNATDVALVWSRILNSLSGGIVTMCNIVASQSAVPHTALAASFALFSLYSRLGGAIGNAIATEVWTNNMPKNLAKQLGGLLNETEIEEIYGSIYTARYTLGEVREGVIIAYNDTIYPLLLGSLVLSVIPIFTALFLTNYFLDERHNVAEKGKTEKDTELFDDLRWLKVKVFGGR